MNRKSSVAHQDFAPGTSRGARSRHTLLLQMARDAEKLAAQAERIKELRALARKSQLETANTIGVTPRAYQEWEAGRGDINPDNLKRLAAYLGTTPDFIEYGAIKRERRATPELIGAPSIDQRLTAIEEELRGLTEVVSELVAGMAALTTRAVEQSSEPRTSERRR